MARRLAPYLFASVLGLAGGCAGVGSSRPSPREPMTAAEHRAAAAREHRLADEKFAEIDPGKVEPPSTLPGRETLGPWYPPFGATNDPQEPEFYTRDPRVHDPNARTVREAREHRRRALRHEAAARELERRRRE